MTNLRQRILVIVKQRCSELYHIECRTSIPYFSIFDGCKKLERSALLILELVLASW